MENDTEKALRYIKDEGEKERTEIIRYYNMQHSGERT